MISNPLVGTALRAVRRFSFEGRWYVSRVGRGRRRSGVPTCGILFSLAAFSFVPVTRAAEGESSGAPAAAVLSPENELKNPSADPTWNALFTSLAKPTNRYSRFEEQRVFPFREKPVVLKGEIRIIPDRGLSLNYSGPKPHTIIIDQKGVLMRDEQGRERSAPDDSRARAVTSALSHILRFDLSALEKEFVIHGLREGDSWTLGFVPREKSLGDLIGTIVVHGRDVTLDHIAMVKSDQQRIEISITDAQAGVIYTMDVLSRYFR